MLAAQIHALALARGTTLIAGTTERFRNAEHSGLETVLAEYLSKHRSLPARAAIALAGPVRGASGAMTNLGWAAAGRPACGSTVAL